MQTYEKLELAKMSASAVLRLYGLRYESSFTNLFSSCFNPYPGIQDANLCGLRFIVYFCFFINHGSSRL